MRSASLALATVTALTAPLLSQAQTGVPAYQPLPSPTYQAPVPPTSPLQTLPNTLPGTVPPLINRAIAPPVGDLSVAANRVPSTNIRLPGGEQIVGGWEIQGRASLALNRLLSNRRDISLIFQKEGEIQKRSQPLSGIGDQDSEINKNKSQEEESINYDPIIRARIGKTTLNDAFNSILRVAGLKAVLQGGNTVLVGRFLPAEAIGLTSRTIRLNQAKAEQAAAFLNRLGAGTTVFYLVGKGSEKFNLGSESKEDSVSKQELDKRVLESFSQRLLNQNRLTENYYPLEPTSKVLLPPNEPGFSYPLRGLTVSADNRLNQVTVVGTADLVNLSIGYLQQLDLRRRQVQLNVKVVDLNLSDLNELNTSFSFRVGDTFITNTNGVLGVTTGGAVPTLTNQLNNRGTIGNTTIPAGGLVTSAPPVVVVPPQPFGGTGQFSGAPAGAVLPNPAYPAAPFLLQPNFLGALQAAVTNKNAKVLTDPTLVVQEGETSTVKITEKIISYLNCTQSSATGGTPIATATPVLDDVGLKLGLSVDRIDDNGFVTVQVTPDLSAPISVQNLGPCVTGGANQTVTLTQNRQTNSGRVRLRDGQSLVLSGVIQDFQRTFEVKFPLLGDLPIFGSLFRSVSNDRERREIIVVVTPRVIDDTDLARFGYNTSSVMQR